MSGPLADLPGGLLVYIAALNGEVYAYDAAHRTSPITPLWIVATHSRSRGQQGHSVPRHKGMVTDDDIQVIGGKKDQFVGKLQERYGMARAQAEKELDTWLQSQHETRETQAPRRRSSGSRQY